ncbi:MAG: glycine--tRNA ligase [Candidatus Yonathbacteria bacterium]|nr:glycine--tRNA ligase [Candidatus Yonathbacteria bacterium]
MAENQEKNDRMEKVISLAKRRGFVYQGSEIYGGLAGTWDWGPLGVALKNNVKNLWWRMFVEEREDMYGVDAAILMNAKVWEASGHVAGFSDPLVECAKCKRRFRADHVEADKCPECDGKLGEARQFNMMFKTHIGAMEGSAAISYLRPETAQGIFVNFKNIIDSFHPKLPFGIGQIGKAFRNEITPRDFIFRVRELEQMEVEYFVHPKEWEKYFEMWRETMWRWIEAIGINKKSVQEHEIEDGERAHYSKRTIDFEFDYPFGRKELYGLAYRTDYDLRKHSEHSSVSLDYANEETKEKFIPHVIEPSLGLDRTILAILLDAYSEDELGEGTRVFLKLKPSIAPVKVAVFPLLKNKPELVHKAREVFEMIKKEIPQTMWDDNGNVGKRYRRQDEIGTPFCITVDFDTLGENPELKDTITVRNRNTGEQERISIGGLVDFLKGRLI